METLSLLAGDWLKPLVKKVVPYPALRWMRDQQQRLTLKKREIFDQVIEKKQSFSNREAFLNFDFMLVAKHRRPGVSALLRVKNEQDKIYHCLASIHDVFDEIVCVDNGSEDRTSEIVREFKERQDKQGKVKLYAYPFKIARCGPEHLNTPEDSVHSLTYYYNWTLSNCSFRYVCKWDGDMVLRKEARLPFKHFLQKLQREQKKCCVLYGQTVYRNLENDYFLAKSEINGEIMIFPNGLNPRFFKVNLFESLKCEPPLDECQFDGVLFYELKFTNTDEFSHWSIADIPTERKKRELENFHLVKNNDISNARFEKLPSSFLDYQIS